MPKADCDLQGIGENAFGAKRSSFSVPAGVLRGKAPKRVLGQSPKKGFKGPPLTNQLKQPKNFSSKPINYNFRTQEIQFPERLCTANSFPSRQTEPCAQESQNRDRTASAGVAMKKPFFSRGTLENEIKLCLIASFSLSTRVPLVKS